MKAKPLIPLPAGATRWSALLLLPLLLALACQPPATDDPAAARNFDVAVIGAGTGATAAAIQAARSGATTLLVTPLPWLGGMLTAAGVSATDGNHRLPAGLWGEFRDSLRQHYGGADSLFTGWVSNTMFEPHVGDYYWKAIAAAEPKLTIWYESDLDSLAQHPEGGWQLVVSYRNAPRPVGARILVDGTDLGDVAARAGADYDLGMDARATTGEALAPERANDILQDLTYVAILKDYGPDADRTIARPAGYDPAGFRCACRHDCDDPQAHDCAKMLEYGRLPNDKFMINWPIEGNDFYVNAVELDAAGRERAFAEAKNQTLQFVYYLQDELGYRHLGLADDEFPTADSLALLPYHREGRRINGLTRLTLENILSPYETTLYRTGIAVGDYPIDHHHDKNPDAPAFEFPPVPSYAVPLGALIPRDVADLVVADKAISVSNLANGTTRLQPVIVQIGQVAGLVAALSARRGVSPAALDVRAVQDSLLAHHGYLLPFIDYEPAHPHFAAVQRGGATGLLRGRGLPYQWANQTWFDGDSSVAVAPFNAALKEYDARLPAVSASAEWLTTGATLAWLAAVTGKEELALQRQLTGQWAEWGFAAFDPARPLTRLEWAVVLDAVWDPFRRRGVRMDGTWAED